MKKIVKNVTYTIGGAVVQKLSEKAEVENGGKLIGRSKIEAKLIAERFIEISKENFKTIFGEDAKPKKGDIIKISEGTCELTKVKKGKVNYKIQMILK
jgi:hypothetical protein